tara:strand:- start:1366 stop:2199 length:834 start_codon:yes stop_codon:yes gene_type:complete
MRKDGNSYGNLATLKTQLGISGTTNDTSLLQSLEMASRSIDTFCGRYFYITSETKQYRGAGNRLFLDGDLLSVTTLTTLKDDRSTDKTWSATDYELFPLGDSTYPKEYIELSDNTTAGSFASGIKRGVQIAGMFGYGNGSSTTPYMEATTTNDGSFSASDTTFTATAGSSLNIGETILIDSEQMYITGISSNTITIQRAMNGTTGALHSTGASVNVYQYPQEVVNACYLQAGRISKRWQTAYATSIGAPEMGAFEVSTNLDGDVQRLLMKFKQHRIA